MASEEASPERVVQVNFRLTVEEHDKLAAWGFVETGSAATTRFARDVLKKAIDEAAAENPDIDRLAQLRSEQRASEDIVDTQ